MKILLVDFNAKVGMEDTRIFKLTIGNASLHEISNDNAVLPHLKTSKVRCSHITTSINIFGCLQMGKHPIRLTIFW
jgi:hypothetical protein